MCRIDKLVNGHLRNSKEVKYSHVFFGSKVPKKFVAFQLTLPMLQKLFISIKEWEIYGVFGVMGI
jgi:hypothetical protein